MSIFEQAARLNNDGVAALLKGDNTSAISSMAKSIKMMKQALSEPEVELREFKTVSLSQEITTVEIPDMDISEHDVYNQALNIPCKAKHTQLDIHVYSAAIIFNLALAHHQKALKGETSCMIKAEKLYGMVLRLIDDAACNMQTAVVVKLASINNLAQIGFANGDFEQAREGLGQISGIMRTANQRLFEEPQIQGLLMNVLLLKAPKVAAAA